MVTDKSQLSAISRQLSGNSPGADFVGWCAANLFAPAFLPQGL